MSDNVNRFYGELVCSFCFARSVFMMNKYSYFCILNVDNLWIVNKTVSFFKIIPAKVLLYEVGCNVEKKSIKKLEIVFF